MLTQQAAGEGDENAQEIRDRAGQHPEPHEPLPVAWVTARSVGAGRRRGMPRVAQCGGDHSQPITALRAGDQALSDDRAQADAVAVDLAVPRSRFDRVLTPDDRVRFVREGVAALEQPDEQVDVLATTRRRGGTESRVKAADLAGHLGQHDEPGPRAKSTDRVEKERAVLTKV